MSVSDLAVMRSGVRPPQLHQPNQSFRTGHRLQIGALFFFCSHVQSDVEGTYGRLAHACAAVEACCRPPNDDLSMGRAKRWPCSGKAIEMRAVNATTVEFKEVLHHATRTY